MMLTFSDKDGEALAALRMAQKLLAEAGLNWAEVLAGLGKPAASPFAGMKPPPQWRWADTPKPPPPKPKPPPHWQHTAEVLAMFEALTDADLPDSISEFVMSVMAQYGKRHSLTDKQLEALRKIYRRNARA